jgi:hypothetical protein
MAVAVWVRRHLLRLWSVLSPSTSPVYSPHALSLGLEGHSGGLTLPTMAPLEDLLSGLWFATPKDKVCLQWHACAHLRPVCAVALACEETHARAAPQAGRSYIHHVPEVRRAQAAPSHLLSIQHLCATRPTGLKVLYGNASLCRATAG